MSVILSASADRQPLAREALRKWLDDGVLHIENRAVPGLKCKGNGNPQLIHSRQGVSHE